MRWREGDAGGEARAFGFRSAGFVDENEFFGDTDLLLRASSWRLSSWPVVETLAFPMRRPFIYYCGLSC
jgi:hypothetical protein